MTRERIAELLEILRIEFLPVWGTTDGRAVTWTTTPDVSKRVTLALNALPRLLDEREALLEALRSLFVLHRAKNGVGHSREEAMAAMALAKAESP